MCFPSKLNHATYFMHLQNWQHAVSLTWLARRFDLFTRPSAGSRHTAAGSALHPPTTCGIEGMGAYSSEAGKSRDRQVVSGANAVGVRIR